MTTETTFDPTDSRLLYVLMAIVAVGITVEMMVTNRLFPAPELTTMPEVVEGRYRFAAAMLLMEGAVALLWLLATTWRRRPDGLIIGRSSLRLWAFAALAVPAVFLAIDLTRTHHFAPQPETTSVVVGQTINEDGDTVDVTEFVLTDVGRTQERRDLFFGVALLVASVGALGWAVKELVYPVPFLMADEEGLLVRVDGPGRPARHFPWPEIAEVRSSLIDDDGAEIPVLSLRFVDAGLVPAAPAGARTDVPWLHLYTDEWEVPAHQVAPFLDQRAARQRTVDHG